MRRGCRGGRPYLPPLITTAGAVRLSAWASPAVTEGSTYQQVL
jgi:hypothetical protein